MLQVADVLYRQHESMTVHPSSGEASRVVKDGLTLVDAYKLVPMGLDEASSIAGLPPIGSVGLPCICERGCGGYCSISPDMPRAHRRQVEDYCALDTRRAYQVLAALSELAEVSGIELRGTLGGTAWASAKARLSLPDANHRTSTWVRIRRASYAGRQTVVRPHARQGTHVDMRSAYAAQLVAHGVPTGPSEELGWRDARKALAKERPGIYRATVTVSADRFLPPLPWRHLVDGRIGYPTGQFTGSWCLPELRAALDRGAVIDRLHSAVTWPREEAIYAPLIKEWFALRQLHGADSATGKWFASLARALTGKLDEAPDREQWQAFPDRIRACDPSERRCAQAGCTRERCSGHCGSMRQIDRWGHWWAVPYFRMGPSAHAEHAAYLKSWCRVHLLEGMEEVGDDLVYSNTDSLWTESELPTRTGDSIGEWHAKGAWGDFRSLSLGCYKYIDLATGEVICRAGGMHLAADAWDRIEDGFESFDDRGVLSLREGILASGDGGKLFRRRYRQQRLPKTTGWYGDRLRLGDGLTYPVARGDLEKRWSRRKAQGEEPAPTGD